MTPEGLSVTLADLAGSVGLAATPQRAGTYTVTLQFTQPARTDTRTLTIVAACPAGQIQLPSGICAEPLEALDKRHHSSLIPQPEGHPTDTCYKTELSDGSRVYTCRRLRDSRVFIAKDSDEVLAASVPHAMYGVVVTVRSGVVREGCQAVSAEDWQCDYVAELIWHQRTAAATVDNYIMPALISGVAEPLNCGRALVGMWLAVGSATPDPRAFTAVVTACEVVIVGEDG